MTEAMEGVVSVFGEVLAGRQTPPAALETSAGLAPGEPFFNGLHHGRAGAEFIAAAAPPEQPRPCRHRGAHLIYQASGGVAEWLKAHAWKACIR